MRKFLLAAIMMLPILSKAQKKIVVNIPDSVFCSESIFKKYDEFDNETVFHTAFSKAMVYKYVKRNSSRIYLSLHAGGSTVTVDGKGVIVLFTDGTKWSRNVKIDVDAKADEFDYNAFIPLTAADLVTFSLKTVRKFRLYIYDYEMPLEDAYQFQQEWCKKSKLIYSNSRFWSFSYMYITIGTLCFNAHCLKRMVYKNKPVCEDTNRSRETKLNRFVINTNRSKGNNYNINF